MSGLPEPSLALLAMVLGLAVGSFTNVVVWRLPRGDSLLRPGSHCPRCGRPLRWWMNVPLVSWLLLGDGVEAGRANYIPAGKDELK